RASAVACCACVASGHDTAAPPSSVMKSRRFMSISPARHRLDDLHLRTQLRQGKGRLGRACAVSITPYGTGAEKRVSAAFGEREPSSSELRQAQYIAVGIGEPGNFGCSARRRPDTKFILRQAIIAVKGDPFAP